MPGLKPGTEEQIIKGMYLLQEATQAGKLRVNLLGSGTILRESMAAKELLEKEWGVGANVWSCPSFNELARDGQNVERWNLLHPTAAPRVPFVTQQLEPYVGPVIASTDYMKGYADQIRAYIPRGRAYKVLGTDGFGRSDFRAKLREHFEVNRHYIVVDLGFGDAGKGTVVDWLCASRPVHAVVRFNGGAQAAHTVVLLWLVPARISKGSAFGAVFVTDVPSLEESL